MSGCPIDFSDGAILRDPEIIGGEFTKPNLVNPSIEGSVALDEDALNSLVRQLEELIKEVAAGSFQDCQGLPLIPDFKIATCSNLADALAASCCGSGGGGTAGSGDTITAVTFNTTTRQLAITVKYADGVTANKTWTVDIPGGGTSTGGGDVIKSMTFDSTTRVLNVSTTFPDGSQVDQSFDVTIPVSPSGDAIKAFSINDTTRVITLETTYPDGSQADKTYQLTVPASPSGDAITAMAFDETTRKLTVSTTFPDSSQADKTFEVSIAKGSGDTSGGDVIKAVDFTDSTRMLKIDTTFPDGSQVDRAFEVNIPGGNAIELAEGSAPATIESSAIPTTSYGGDIANNDRGYFLAEPDAWGKVVIDDLTYVVPLYKVAAAG